MMNSIRHTSEYGHLYLIGDSDKKSVQNNLKTMEISFLPLKAFMMNDIIVLKTEL